MSAAPSHNNVFTTTSAVGVWQADPASYKLPHPSVALPVIKIVCYVLAHAFEELRKQGKDLAALSEDEITAKLMEFLENTLLKADGDPAKGGIPGFTKTIFRSVTRQSNAQSYNQQKVRPSPDLWFLLNYDQRPEVLPSYDALLVECKIVDKTSKRSAGPWYGDEGMIRFVNGDYAWAMTEGIMLAYARDSRTIADHLIPALAETARMATLKTQTLPVPVPFKALMAKSVCQETLHQSTHGRGFTYLENKGIAPDITLYHLWLRCDLQSGGAVTLQTPDNA
ncbi:hypothetical protein [Prosthecobacter sp.]|jgi:hypothetical protein|uniref:hypothetical protein n=1 Tax=Prosthecobacter sp. TaxID=1965333 RepID=UPI0037C68FB4